ncbi:MAG TPA: hypothetical protein EYG27_04345, partial [Dehalococcoidia bacterium]|nr:hypothetical protein [Dehalococcoidia bacterium]
AMKALHPLLQRLALRRGYILVTGDSTRLRESHLVAMETLAQSERGGRALELPVGVVLRQEYGQLMLAQGVRQDCPYPELESEYQVMFPTEPGSQTAVSAGDWIVTMYAGTPTNKPDWGSIQSGDQWTVCLGRSAIGDGATIRKRRPGDRIQPLGMTGQKKLQDLLTDLHVPRAWRDSVPLLEGEMGIGWVVGHRIANWAKVDQEADDPVLWIRFSRNQD